MLRSLQTAPVTAEAGVVGAAVDVSSIPLTAEQEGIVDGLLKSLRTAPVAPEAAATEAALARSVPWYRSALINPIVAGVALCLSVGGDAPDPRVVKARREEIAREDALNKRLGVMVDRHNREVAAAREEQRMRERLPGAFQSCAADQLRPAQDLRGDLTIRGLRRFLERLAEARVRPGTLLPAHGAFTIGSSARPDALIDPEASATSNVTPRYMPGKIWLKPPTLDDWRAWEREKERLRGYSPAWAPDASAVRNQGDAEDSGAGSAVATEPELEPQKQAAHRPSGEKSPANQFLEDARTHGVWTALAGRIFVLGVPYFPMETLTLHTRIVNGVPVVRMWRGMSRADFDALLEHGTLGGHSLLTVHRADAAGFGRIHQRDPVLVEFLIPVARVDLYVVIFGGARAEGGGGSHFGVEELRSEWIVRAHGLR
ncbi:MAG: hypothetical protein V1798_07405 [Pseudomonadota bacterium]